MYGGVDQVLFSKPRCGGSVSSCLGSAPFFNVQREETMSINVECAGCGKRLQTTRDNAGKQLKCPACRHLIRVPGMTVPPLPPAAKPSPDIAPSIDDSTFATTYRKRSRGSAKLLSTLVGAVLASATVTPIFYFAIWPSIKEAQKKRRQEQRAAVVRKQQPLGFDPLSFERTKKWSHAFAGTIKNPDNMVSYQQEIERLKRELVVVNRQQTGQAVRWTIPVKRVTDRVELEARWTVHSIERGRDGDTRDIFVQIYFLPGRKPNRWGLHLHKRIEVGKQISAAHAARLEAGDTVSIEGKVKMIHMSLDTRRQHILQIVLENVRVVQ